jgi:hypothetical protein
MSDENRVHSAWRRLTRRVAGMSATSRIRDRVFPVIVALVVAGSAGCALVGDLYRPPLRGVDLNTAAVEELTELPGVSEEDAARIVAQRPYQNESELVSRGAVSEEQLGRFADRTYVSRVRADGGPETRSCAPVVPDAHQ